jgi:hypothetical protein
MLGLEVTEQTFSVPLPQTHATGKFSLFHGREKTSTHVLKAKSRGEFSTVIFFSVVQQCPVVCALPTTSNTILAVIVEVAVEPSQTSGAISKKYVLN